MPVRNVLSSYKRYKYFLCLSIVGLAAGCSRSQVVPMSHAAFTPAAVAEVKAHEEGNGNTALKVDVRHLAPPQALGTGASTYVVWAQDRAGTGDVQNLGELKVDENRSGTLETLTPMHKFDVFITAEPTASVTSPSGDKALWASVSQD